MMSIMKISMMLAIFFVVCAPVVMGAGGKGKEPMIVFNQALLDRGLAAVRTRMHIGNDMRRTPAVDDRVYAIVGRPTRNMLANVEGAPTPLVFPAVIDQIRHGDGLEPGAMTIYLRWNDGVPRHRHVNMNQVFYRNEVAPGDDNDVEENVAMHGSVVGGGGGVGTDAIVGSGVQEDVCMDRTRYELVTQLDNTELSLHNAEQELLTTHLALANSNLENVRLNGEIHRLTLEMRNLHERIAIAATDTDTAIIEATAVGTAAGTAAASATAVATAGVTAITLAASMASANSTRSAPPDDPDPTDPGTTNHDDNERPKRRKTQRNCYNPSSSMYDRSGDWNDDEGNCGGGTRL